MNTSPALQLLTDTLLLIPCSGDKQHGSKASKAVSILSALDPALAVALTNARAAICEKAQVDETTLTPAYLRYSGQLYKYGATSIGRAIAAGQRVLIVSGGYGLLLADEPIGCYKKRFFLSDWPAGLLEKCILDYAHHEGMRSAVAVMSRTTDYARLIKLVKWNKAGLAAVLVSPVAQGGGDLVTVPRAQGQAIAALINTGLGSTWRSSDSLSLTVKSF